MKNKLKILFFLVISIAFIDAINCSANDTNTVVPNSKVESIESDSTIILEDEEEPPLFDYNELTKNVVYPEDAYKNGIEGVVVLNVLIGKKGEVQKVTVRSSDNAILNDAAINAVKKTKFQAAIENNAPVSVWVQLPITFKLK